MIDTVEQNVAAVRAAIARAARAAGREPGEITLLAATKSQPVDRIRKAIRAGVDAAGENRVREMLEKGDAYEGVPLHFIGRLQKNKAKFVVGRACLIHSVDSMGLAGLIDRLAAARQVVQDVLLEVNIGREPTKGGFLPDETSDCAQKIQCLPHLRLRGLMCIPPPVPSPEKAVPYFLEMQQLYVDITTNLMDNGLMKILSMGMSADFEAAIACGSTLVRVGSGIFGARTAEPDT